MRSSVASRTGFLARPARRARTGISLLEVLVSIFVLSIGLLAVAAIIPVARFQMIEAAKADRSTACATAALNDLRVRGALNPDEWRNVTGGSLGQTEPEWMGSGGYMLSSGDRGYLFGESYALDPLYVAEAEYEKWSDRDALSDFPYNPDSPGNRILGGTGDATRWTRLQRMTWTGVGGNILLASSMFQWDDDLLFPLPADDTQRPDQLSRAIDHASGYRQLLKGKSQGNYMYLVTVVPSPDNVDFFHPLENTVYSFPENSPLYRVSVAVFYKRDMSGPKEYLPADPADDDRTGLMEGETPGERQVRLQFLGSGLGGGDVQLSTFDGQGAEYLAVKQNEWILVSGFYMAQRTWTDRDGFLRTYTMPVGVHQWYRIVAAGDIITGNPHVRDVTLAGPDWNLLRWNNDYGGGGVPPPYLATLLKGVVGVYSTTVELTP